MGPVFFSHSLQGKPRVYKLNFFSTLNAKMFASTRSFGQKKENLNLDTLKEITRPSDKTLRKSA